MSNPTRHKKLQTPSNGAKTLPTALEARFASARSQLNPRRQQLIRGILDSSDETCFLSSRELGKRYNTDAATIIRTIQVMGYEKFVDFTADLRQHFVSRITPYTVLKAATREQLSVADHIDHSLDKALESINSLKSNMDRKQIIELARLIHRSRAIMVIGVDFAASLAEYLAYGLGRLGFDAEAPVGSAGTLQYKVEILTNRDMLIAISFGQCLRETVEAVLLARKQRVPTFGITDSDTTPIARYCDRHLNAGVANPSFITSYVAPIAAITAIHVACTHINPKRSLNRLKPTDREYISGRRWYREPKGFNGAG